MMATKVHEPSKYFTFVASGLPLLQTWALEGDVAVAELHEQCR